jgi:hypothetical protein
LDRQLVSSDVAWVVGMSFDPSKVRLCPTHLAFPYAGNYGLDQILVLNGLSGGGFPVILLPLREPLGETLDTVVGIGVDEDGTVDGNMIQCSGDSRQFSALVRLPLSTKRF